MNEKQLTVRGLIIGAIGSVILTMSSMFIALKLSSLPWPIMFVVLVSMFVLKLMGNTNLQEINVTQTVCRSNGGRRTGFHHSGHLDFKSGG